MAVRGRGGTRPARGRDRGAGSASCGRARRLAAGARALRPTAALVAAVLLPALAAACGGSGTSGAEMQGRALRFAEAVGGRDTAVLHRLVAEDYVLHAGPLPGGELRGRAAFLVRVASDTTAWPRGRIVVTHILSGGDQVAEYGVFARGGNPLRPETEPESSEGVVPVATVHRFEDGRIAETWAVWDTRALERLRSDTAKGAGR